MKQGELLARISAQLRVKADATWVQSIVKGVLEDDSEAMNILQTILPEQIISRIQVSINARLPAVAAVDCFWVQEPVLTVVGLLQMCLPMQTTA